MATKENQSRKKIYLILMILFLLGFLVSSVVLVRDYITEKRADEQYEALVENILPTESETADTEIATTETEGKTPDILAERGITIPDLELDWAALAETNEDIYSWIYIPETKVNYPVLQHATEDDYYLDRNLDHSQGLPGCIYTQRLNAKDYSDGNTVLYGHNMKNGTMFKTLHYFEDGQFFDENRYIYIYTPDTVLVYEIYAACEFSNAHLLYSYDFTSEEGTNKFLADLQSTRGMNNHIMQEFEFPEETRLVTLSTCIGSKPNNRWLVVGVLLGEKAVEE